MLDKTKIHTVLGKYEKNKIYTKDGVIENVFPFRIQFDELKFERGLFNIFYNEQLKGWTIIQSLEFCD